MEDERRHSILIVDDEASNLYILNQILKDRYTIYAARTGMAALKIAGEKRPELVLLDVILPDISGYEVLTGLKNSDATRDIPVLIISGLANEENEQKSVSLGAAGYIAKPFNSHTVKEKVEALLNLIS